MEDRMVLFSTSLSTDTEIGLWTCITLYTDTTQVLKWTLWDYPNNYNIWSLYKTNVNFVRSGSLTKYFQVCFGLKELHNVY